MTQQKHLKKLVRSRMAKTGESYTSARRQVLQRAEPLAKAMPFPWHCAGQVPAATALRILLKHTATQMPSKQAASLDLSEAMVFGLAGGIGIGCFSFLYEKENFASLFLGGRHLWHDDLAYLTNACERLGLKPTVNETGSTKAADKALRDALEQGPCIAWVDAGSLPHRAMPAHFSGGGYHVVTIYAIEGDSAVIGDLTDEPISIALADLAAARARIAKQKNRLLWLPLSPAAGESRRGQGVEALELKSVVPLALKACHDGLLGKGGVKSAAGNFSLEVLKQLGERMHGSKDKQSWDKVFPPGPRLWNGLTMMHDFIEHHGTGGGLCRPIFADSLREAGATLKDQRLTKLAERYADLGGQWSELADAALPDHVPVFKEAKELMTRKAELLHEGAEPAELSAVWHRLGELAAAAKSHFPLSTAAAEDLRTGLKEHVLALYEREKLALQDSSVLG